MSVEENHRHVQQVDAWIKQYTKGLSSENLLQIFGAAIHAVQKRAAFTLSEVTLGSVVNRVLLTSQHRFPILNDLKLSESKCISLDALIARSNQLTCDEITAAFRFFLIELLTLLSNLTADILTKPLYQALYMVKADHPQIDTKAKHGGLRSIKSSSDQGDV